MRQLYVTLSLAVVGVLICACRASDAIQPLAVPPPAPPYSVTLSRSGPTCSSARVP
jgi:hypothetical protein